MYLARIQATFNEHRKHLEFTLLQALGMGRFAGCLRMSSRMYILHQRGIYPMLKLTRTSQNEFKAWVKNTFDLEL